MNIVEKIALILFLPLFIHAWNRIVLKNMIHRMVRFHKKHNSESLNRQPIKFLIKNEKKIYQAGASFYWVGAAIIIIGTILEE